MKKGKSRQEKSFLSERGKEDEGGADHTGPGRMWGAPLMLSHQGRALRWELACGRRYQVLWSKIGQAAWSAEGEITQLGRGRR